MPSKLWLLYLQYWPVHQLRQERRTFLDPQGGQGVNPVLFPLTFVSEHLTFSEDILQRISSKTINIPAPNPSTSADNRWVYLVLYVCTERYDRWFSVHQFSLYQHSLSIKLYYFVLINYVELIIFNWDRRSSVG